MPELSMPRWWVPGHERFHPPLEGVIRARTGISCASEAHRPLGARMRIAASDMHAGQRANCRMTMSNGT